MGILSYLHKRAKAKHDKLSQRLAKNLRTGNFEQLTPYQKSRSVRNLEKQRLKLTKLAFQLALITGVSVGGIAVPNQTFAQGVQAEGLGPFEESARNENPLRAPIQIRQDYVPRFDLADIDGDGDADLYVAGYYEGNEYFFLFENLQVDLDAPGAVFKDKVDFSLPLLFSFNEIHLSFIDADGDLDLDLYVSRGSVSQPSTFFRNDGGINSDIALADFVPATYTYDNIFGESNNFIAGSGYFPASGPIGFIKNESLAQVDIDGDNDLDFFVGTYNSGIKFLRNDGGLLYDIPHSFNSIGGETQLNFIDLDQDGDQDVFIGFRSGPVRFYRNDDINTVDPDLVIDDPDNFVLDDFNPINPFQGNDIGNEPRPDIVDIDMDGDLDIVVGIDNPYDIPGKGPYYHGTNFRTWINDGMNPYSFTEVSSLDNPFGGVDVYENATPTFADIDGDNDLDAFVGARHYKIRFFENETDGFHQKMGIDNPLDSFDDGIYGYMKLELADTDNDGDLDAYVGVRGSNPRLNFFNNNGSGFDFPSDNSNSLVIEVGNLQYDPLDNPFPSIGDLDGDGDLDAFVGGIYSFNYCSPQFHHFFENLISPSPPPSNTPPLFDYGVEFPSIYFNQWDIPEVADLDHDGDLDIQRARGFGNIGTIRNDGSLNFTQLTGTDNHLYEINSLFSGENPAIDIVDFDKDGDLDVFLGDRYGHIRMFENTNTPLDVSLGGGPLNINEQDPANIIFSIAAFDDPEINMNTNIVTVEVGIVGFSPGEAVISFSDQSGIAGNSDGSFNSTGIFELRGSATFADYITAINSSLMYQDLSDNPPPVRTLELRVWDSDFTDPNVYTKTINITAVNDPPVLDPIVAASATEDILFTYNGVVTDPDDANNGTGLTWSLTGAPAGMTVSNTGIVTWTPIDGVLTSGPVTLRVTDTGGLFSEQSFSIAVTPVNDPPSITSTAGTAATEGSSYTYTPTVVDPDDANDGTNLTWSLSGQPSGMIVSATGVVTWTPADGVLTSGAVTLSVQDGGENGALPASEVFTITVTPVNSTPSLNLSASTAAYTENAFPLVLAPLATVSDADAINLSFDITATITNFQSGEDVLDATPAGSVTATFDNILGVMTIGGTGSVSQFQTVLRSLTYENTSEDPNTTTRTISIVADDGTVSSSTQTIDVSITSVNDAPVVAGSSIALDHSSGISVIDPNLIASDLDNTELVSAQVSISSGFNTGTDLLGFTPQGGITGSYDNSTGILTLSGNGTTAEYTSVLKSVTYQNTLGLDVSTRTIQFTVNDGTIDSNVFSRTINVDISDLPPVLALTTTSFSYTENAGPQSINPGITITDDSPSITGGSIAITSNFVSGDDILGFTDQSGITGTYESSTGILSLTGSATVAQYEAAIASLTYENTSDDPGSVIKTIQIQLDDGTNTSPAVSLDIQITPVNDAPEVSGSTSDLSYRSLTGAIIVDDQITISDLDDTDLIGANVSIATGYSSGEDLLGFSDQNGITGSFNAITGVLSLSGTASVTDYETALGSITYQNNTPVPSASSKPISFVVSDATTNSSTFSRSISIESNQVVAALVTSQVDVGASVTIDVISQANFTTGDQITVSITNMPAMGTAVLNPDGTITYTPDDDAEDGDIDVITYELCNEYFSCGSNDIEIEVLNAAPEVDFEATLIEPGSTATVPLLQGITDSNDNIDPSSIKIIGEPSSGVTATIDTNHNLIINYSGSGFTGADHIMIEVCDFSGACTQFDVVIAVGPVEVVLIYNGVTPNNDGINDVLRILDVEFFPNNEMFIYNKIGKIVYNVTGYNNFDTVFSGIGNDGEELPNGTYYYVIILDDDHRQAGYIVLQR